MEPPPEMTPPPPPPPTTRTTDDGKMGSTAGGVGGHGDDPSNLESTFRKGDPNISVDLSSVPVRVENVLFDGLGRTKRDYLQKAISGIFMAKNFEELILQVGIAQNKLRSLHIFREVGTLLDTSKGPETGGDGYEIIFLVKELRRINGGVSGMVGSNEGTAQMGINLPNLFGRGENLAVNKLVTSKSGNRLELNFTVPSPYTSSLLTYSLYKCQSPNPFSSVTTESVGGDVRLDFKPRRDHICSLQWENVWRQLTALNPLAPFSVREYFGNSFKSAFRMAYARDKRDQPIFPQTGDLRKVTVELAGIMGDAKFVKVESDLQINRSIASTGIVLQAGLRSGIFQPLSQSGLSHEINDLFFLGGPCSLRGFAMRGVGPRSQQNALGGRVVWASGFHIYSSLPFVNKQLPMVENLRMHGFLNFGAIGATVRECMDYKNIRGSAGFGIAYAFHNMARLELNYCYPFKVCGKDQFVRGFQFGLGIDFL